MKSETFWTQSIASPTYLIIYLLLYITMIGTRIRLNPYKRQVKGRKRLGVVASTNVTRVCRKM